MAERTDRQMQAALPLRRLRLRMTAVMIFERAWPLLVPVLSLAALFLGLSWVGAFRLLPDWPRIGLVALFAVGLLAALFPFRRFRLPAPAEVDRRIEARNALRHEPLRAQSDRPAGAHTDGFGAALWREHQRRMARQLDGLSGDLPRTRVPERDPWALRAAALLFLAIAFAFSTGPLGGSVADAFRAAPLPAAPPPRIDAWVTPPAYTGKPPVFLSAETAAERAAVTAPQGSIVTLRVTGGSGSEMAAFESGGTAVAIEPKGTEQTTENTQQAAVTAGARQFEVRLERDGSLALSGKLGAELARWRFSVIPDRPPVVAFAGEPKRAVNGTLDLSYSIVDDYGAASAKGLIVQADQPALNARPLYAAPDLPLTLPRRGGKDGKARTTRDLTQHPWAGVRAKLTLEATDGAGQTARSETKILVLPEKPFSDPLARALVEQRRLLALDANAKRRVLDMLDAVTLRPEDTFSNMAHYLAVMSARSRLKLAQDDDALRGVVDYLWEIALGIEDSGLSDAEKRLRQAQEALKQALENGASDEEINKLMKELRAAMDEFMREFAEQAAKNPDQAMQPPQDGQELRQSDLEKMMDKIEELAKSGARDKAQELLSQLQDMMNNLQAAKPQQGQGQQGQMREQMNKLGELMRKQQEMMNETFRLDREMQNAPEQGDPGNGQQGQEGENGQGEQQGQEGEGGQGRQPGRGKGGRPMSRGEIEQALRGMQQGQEGLKGDLEALMKDLEGMGMKPGQGFGEAGEAMGEAGRALGDAMGEDAAGEQGRALEALRKGAQNMMEQMRQAMQGEQGGGEEGGRQQDADRDPLGRPKATNGPDFGNSVEVPDEIDVQRARRILEAIRKRLGDSLSPEVERSYLERLLELR